MLAKTSVCVAAMMVKMDVFLIEDDDLLKKHNTSWYKVSIDIKIQFNSKPVYNKTFLKTKSKSYDD